MRCKPLKTKNLNEQHICVPKVCNSNPQLYVFIFICWFALFAENENLLKPSIRLKYLHTHLEFLKFDTRFLSLNTFIKMVFIEYFRNVSGCFMTHNSAFIDFLWCSSSIFTKSKRKYSKNLNQDLISAAMFTSNQQWKTNKFQVESMVSAFISSLIHLSFCLSLS